MVGLENIADKEYLGRVIIIGRDKPGKNDFIIYAVTGRGEPSRARRFKKDDDCTVRTEVTDEKQLKKGNPKLLIYNCIRRYNDNLIVSNGAQTDVIYGDMDCMAGQNTPLSILTTTFDSRRLCLVPGNKEGEFIDLLSYEPDDPNYTPRISGILAPNSAAMCIVKHRAGQAERHFFEIPMINGLGKVIATYTGQNVPKGHKIPSFTGEPYDVEVIGESPEEVTNMVYEALGPKQPGPGIISPGDDFRVGVCTTFFNRSTYTISTFYKNRNEG